MANGIMIMGPSGSGKTTSLRNLKPEETFIINVQGKAFPFKSKGYEKFDPKTKKGNVYKGDVAANIIKVLNFIDAERPDIKTVIVDDGQYVAANEFMAKADQKGFDKFTSIGKNLWSMANSIAKLDREDLNIYFMWHTEEITEGDGFTKSLKAKTVGKLVDNVVTLEGMFTIVLHAQVVKAKDNKPVEYKFKTQNEGESTAKSPMGLFDELYIDNDLQVINQKINDYYL